MENDVYRKFEAVCAARQQEISVDIGTRNGSKVFHEISAYTGTNGCVIMKFEDHDYFRDWQKIPVSNWPWFDSLRTIKTPHDESR